MNTYNFSFIGRITGAIGITYKINDKYKAHSLVEALYMLNTDYDSIRQLKCNGEFITDAKLTKCDVPKRNRDPKTGDYIK